MESELPEDMSKISDYLHGFLENSYDHSSTMNLLC